MNKSDLTAAFGQTLRAFGRILPILLGTIFLISLVKTAGLTTYAPRLFTGWLPVDAVAGALLGSLLAGNPIISYVLSGELLNTGVHLIPVLAFLTAWVTVGVVQLPAEIMLLGKRFAILRNGLSFVSAIGVAWLTYVILTLLS